MSTTFRPTSTNWYCVHTKPRKEEVLSRFCAETLGLDVFYPRIKLRKKIRRKPRQVILPLFPRYFFCRFDPGVHFRAVTFAPDAIGLVTFGQSPVIVDPAIVEEIRDWAGDGINMITVSPGFKPGDRVEITDGPMKHLTAVFCEEMRGSERVALLLSILNSEVRVVIDRAQIRLAS